MIILNIVNQLKKEESGNVEITVTEKEGDEK